MTRFYVQVECITGSCVLSQSSSGLRLGGGGGEPHEPPPPAVERVCHCVHRVPRHARAHGVQAGRRGAREEAHQFADRREAHRMRPAVVVCERQPASEQRARTRRQRRRQGRSIPIPIAAWVREPDESAAVAFGYDAVRRVPLRQQLDRWNKQRNAQTIVLRVMKAPKLRATFFRLLR